MSTLSCCGKYIFFKFIEVSVTTSLSKSHKDMTFLGLMNFNSIVCKLQLKVNDHRNRINNTMDLSRRGTEEMDVKTK